MRSGLHLVGHLFISHQAFLRTELMKCNAQQEARNGSQNETRPNQILNKLKGIRRPMRARNDSKHERNHAIDQNPNRMSIMAQQKEEHDVDHPFGDEKYADHESEKNQAQKRIRQQNDRAKCVNQRNCCMLGPMRCFEMNSEQNVSRRRDEQKPA
jgi:hypothetical protein